MGPVTHYKLTELVEEIVVNDAPDARFALNTPTVLLCQIEAVFGTFPLILNAPPLEIHSF